MLSENELLGKAPYLVGVIGFVLLVYFWCTIDDKFEAIILFVTLEAILFYVKDTRRIAELAALQPRIYWIQKLFESLSIRMDATMKDINTTDSKKRDEHQRELALLFDSLIGIAPSKEFKEIIEQEKANAKKAFIDQNLDKLNHAKKELQICVGKIIRIE